jgi:diaminohydroxyphosphoribosylaminopyrimidine deaminase / 5-amino-6-(5-phosphoribosylamino)uracil reductase
LTLQKNRVSSKSWALKYYLMTDLHEKYMRRALLLARKGIGKTGPNRAVGCVIVRDGAIVGEGWHRRAGTPHAEVHALAAAGGMARGADVYVTLEPCAHFGKTPPCAEALIAAGVGRVYAGMVDPNPQVAGKGLEMLAAAGIGVVAGVLEDACRDVNEPFIKHVTTGLPFVVLKSALTMDGKSATSCGDARWITNERSRRFVHKMRSRLDAIMVGVGTVIADDPELTCRIPGGKDPLRVVVDSGLRIPLHARLFHLKSSAKTLVAAVSGDASKIAGIRGLGADILLCREKDGRVDLHDMMARLGAMGVQSLLLEGGSTLAGEALRLGMIDKAILFYAPKLVGGDGPGPFSGSGVERMEDAIRLKKITLARFGEDILIQGYPEISCSRA